MFTGLVHFQCHLSSIHHFSRTSIVSLLFRYPSSQRAFCQYWLHRTSLAIINFRSSSSRVLVVVSSRSCVAFPLSAFPFPTISRRRESRCRWPGAVGDMRRCWSSGDLVMFRCGCRWCGLWVMSALGCGCWQQRQPARRQSRLTDSCSVAVRRQRDRQPLLVSLTLSCYFVLSLVICVTVDVIVGVVVFIVFHLSSRLNWKHYVFGLSIRLCVPSGGILRLACRRLLMKSNWL